MSMTFTIPSESDEQPDGTIDLSNGAACLMIVVLGLNHDGKSTAGEHPAADMLTKIAAVKPTQAERDQMESYGLQLDKVIGWFKELAENAVRSGAPNVVWY